MSVNVCMRNILNHCNQPKVEYINLKTSGNDPKITKAQRYSQYVRTAKTVKHYEDPYTYLDNRGLVYKSYFSQTIVPPSTFIDNDIVFPREQFFVTAIQRKF